MTTDKDAAHFKIGQLVSRFDEQYTSYKRTEYNETQTRRDFIDPFFKALGWDVDNEQGNYESYREVIHEDKIRIGDARKAPDYSFKLAGGKRLFFVEAKKPSVLIKDEIDPAYQVRRYGWSAKLPISIVTDFEEFAIYDCTKKPNPSDKASTARIKYLTFPEYLKEFDFIWETFSKERVLKGSFDRFVQNDTYKKGTATVDNDFLQSLDRWRTYLATSIARNNKNLNEDEINFVVQQTIDRIIFLRIAEDRSIEPYGNLKDCIKQGDSYKNLFQVFKKADQKYNSGLFDFKKDQYSQGIEIENKIIKTIINELYYPECPYAFSVLPVEILGTAYEQFLGKVIRITPAHHAKIEEKPEVRKAGGVYYTPQYIVDYIVENTVGKLIEGKTPKEISKIKILDPACGSGSFLLGAYQYLLNYHKKYYTKNGKPSIIKKDNQLTPEGNLITTEKKRILTNNIFGVDIDLNAVEVTKLSLLLKCMEGETSASIAHQLAIFHERVLPTLDSNVKDGNSLIDTDFYDSQLDFGEEKKIKPFNWQNAFSEIFKYGGFDVIIGNPPYVNVENLNDESKTYFFKKFQTCKGRTDIYIAFIEKSLSLAKKKGVVSFIIPYAFTNQKYGEIARQLLINNAFIKEIIDTSNYFVFNQANVKNIILTYENIEIEDQETSIKCITSEMNFIKEEFQLFKIEQKQFLKFKDSRFETKPIGNFESLKNKLLRETIALGEICLIAYGARLNHKTKKIGKEAYLFKDYTKNYKPFTEGKNIQQYSFTQNGWLNYKPEEHYNSMFPELFESEKIMFINVVKDKLRFAYDNKGFYNSHTVINCVRLDKLITASHITARKAVQGINIDVCKSFDYLYLLGILNSKLINWYFITYLSEGLHFYPSDAQKLPIKNLFGSKNEIKESSKEILKVVKQLLVLKEEIQSTNLSSRIEQLQIHILHCEEKINKIVYELYNLTQEEIKIIEETIK
jgi:type I restriction-modification system DNA methylase subunit